MAIIQGMRPAEMGDVKPFELPIDDMAKGVMAVQGRADEVKNTIALGDSALKIETRPIQEDMDLSNQVSSEYKSEWEKMLVDAGGDYSKIDNSQIQSLATKYASDDRVRYLTSAKKNYDAMLDIQKKIQVDGGQALMFGPVDPNKMSLKDETGAWRNFSDWDLEKHLQYLSKAQSVFGTLGYKLKDTIQWTPQKGDFGTYWFKYWDEHKDNMGELQPLIDEGANMFKMEAEGVQFMKKKRQDLLKINPQMTEAEILKETDEQIKDMIFAIGRSKQIVEDKTDSSMQHIQNPPKDTGGGPRGIKDKENPTPVISIAPISNQTYYGAKLLNNTGNWIESSNSILSENYIAENPRELATNTQSITNVNALKEVMRGVAPNNIGEGAGDKKFFPGTLYNLDANLNETDYRDDKNRSVARIFNTDLIGTKDKLAVLKERGNEASILDVNDYATAYAVVNGTSIETGRKVLIGSSKMDGYSSMFNFETDESTGDTKLIIDPVIAKAKELLEKKLTDNPNDEYTKEKLNRLNSKLAQTEEYKKQHADDIKKHEQQFYHLHQTAKTHKMIHNQVASAAGLGDAEIDELEDVHDKKGNKDSYFTAAGSVFSDAKINALSSYVTDWWKKPTTLVGWIGSDTAYASPNFLLRRIGGANGGGNNMEKSLEIGKGILNDKSSKKHESVNRQFNIFTSVLNDAIEQDITPDQLKKVMGENKFNEVLKANYASDELQNWHLFKAYGEALLLKEPDSNEKKYVIEAIAGIGTQFIKGKDGYKQFEYLAGETPQEAQIKMKDKRAVYLDNAKKSHNINIPTNVKTYLEKSEETLKDYGAANILYMFPGATATPGYVDMKHRIVNQTSFAVNNPGSKVTRLNFNRQGDEGEPLTEEINPDYINQQIAKYAGQKGMTSSNIEIRKKFFEEYTEGIIYDHDNPKHPFSAVISIPRDDEGKSPIKVQVEITPDPADLHLFGVEPIHTRYLNDLRKGLLESGGVSAVLDYEGKKTKIFKANTKISEDIKKGDFYIIGTGDPNEQFTGNTKMTKLGGAIDAINRHVDRAFEGKNISYIKQLTLMMRAAQESKNPEETLIAWGMPTSTKGSNFKLLQKQYQDAMSNSNGEEESENEGK